MRTKVVLMSSQNHWPLNIIYNPSDQRNKQSNFQSQVKEGGGFDEYVKEQINILTLWPLCIEMHHFEENENTKLFWVKIEENGSYLEAKKWRRIRKKTHSTCHIETSIPTVQKYVNGLTTYVYYEASSLCSPQKAKMDWGRWKKTGSLCNWLAALC